MVKPHDHVVVVSLTASREPMVKVGGWSWVSGAGAGGWFCWWRWVGGGVMGEEGGVLRRKLRLGGWVYHEWRTRWVRALIWGGLP